MKRTFWRKRSRLRVKSQGNKLSKICLRSQPNLSLTLSKRAQVTRISHCPSLWRMMVNCHWKHTWKLSKPMVKCKKQLERDFTDILNLVVRPMDTWLRLRPQIKFSSWMKVSCGKTKKKCWACNKKLIQQVTLKRKSWDNYRWSEERSIWTTKTRNHKRPKDKCVQDKLMLFWPSNLMTSTQFVNIKCLRHLFKVMLWFSEASNSMVSGINTRQGIKAIGTSWRTK